MTRPIELPNLDHFIERYRAGVSLKQLAKEAGCSRDVFYRLFRRHGVTLRNRSEAEIIKWAGIKTDPAAVAGQCGAAWQAADAKDANIERRILSLYRSGLTSKRAIAKQTGAGLSNISRLLRKHGIRDDARPLRRAVGKIGIAGAELPLADELLKLGVDFIHQAAVGRRNLDFGFPQVRVGVEIVRRHWNDAKSLRRERLEEIFGQGWRLFVIYDPNHLGIDFARCAQRLVAYLDQVRRQPAAPGQYGMVRGNGEPVPEARAQLHHFSRVEGF